MRLYVSTLVYSTSDLYKSCARFGIIAAAISIFSASAAAQIDLRKKNEPRFQKKPVTIVDNNPPYERAKPPAGVEIISSGNAGISDRDADGKIIGAGFGEIQSAVVPPGKKSECPNGRLLISNDAILDPARIFRFDYAGSKSTPASVTPQALPDPVNQGIFSNDHDLVSLNNGDVLLLKMGRSKATLDPLPVWFNHTYKLSDCKKKKNVLTDAGAPGAIFVDRECKSSWGPGARSAIYIWRSEDCGDSFAYKTMIDTALVNDGWGTHDDGSGGLPQAIKDFAGGVTTPPGTVEQPAFQMAGTDGPLAEVDRATGRVYYTMRLAGRKPVENGAQFALGEPIGRSVVMMSDDRGDTWTEATTLQLSTWRTPVATMGNNRLGFLHARTAADCGPGIFDCYVYYETNVGSNLDPSSEPDEGITRLFPAPNPWTNVVMAGNKTVTVALRLTNIGTNVFDHKLMTRNPDTAGALMVFSQKSVTGGSGYAMYSIVPEGFLTGIPQIAPIGRNDASFILHPTAIDIGYGPVLFYWYDVNAENGTMIIRGRFVTGARDYTSDFSISELFSLPTAKKWFGDYHTADGYVRVPQIRSANAGAVQLPGPSGERPQTYEYFPVWIQPDGRVHFARVSYTKPDDTVQEQGHNKFTEKARALPKSLPPNFKISDVEAVEQSYPGQ